MKVLQFLSVFFFVACASRPAADSYVAEGSKIFSYTDLSGRFQLHRDRKLQRNLVVTRNLILQTDASREKTLEKSVLVSKLGSIKTKKGPSPSVRPQASDFTVWLEAKKYGAKMRVDEATRSMMVTMESPEKKWHGQTVVKFPKGRYFCYYGQLAECLFQNRLLQRAVRSSKPLLFTLVWESWPYTSEMLTNVGKDLFSSAILRFEGEDRGLYRIEIEVDGQIMLYYFSKAYELVKIAWIAQGITVVPLGEEAPVE